MWQDFVFMIGSSLSIAFLAPTLRDASSRVPLGTSLPSMAIGVVYGITFMTLGMTLSALGALASGTMWALIAAIRSPTGKHLTGRLLRLESPTLLATDLRRWLEAVRSSVDVDQYTTGDQTHTHTHTSSDHAAD
ncbi:hypothetical protein SAMN04487967_3336 [Natronorubrum sediminis]|uniref:Uncharacterized protein n=2 Tax=Natronorubrum sediminis TaxID=640943 RepID=A0A1H6G5S4_9EURY|nr:hypothetical protein SAMN04487967_3336 [Natronorubrum sediminis]